MTIRQKEFAWHLEHKKCPIDGEDLHVRGGYYFCPTHHIFIRDGKFWRKRAIRPFQKTKVRAGKLPKDIDYYQRRAENRMARLMGLEPNRKLPKKGLHGNARDVVNIILDTKKRRICNVVSREKLKRR